MLVGGMTLVVPPLVPVFEVPVVGEVVFELVVFVNVLDKFGEPPLVVGLEPLPLFAESLPFVALAVVPPTAFLVPP